MIAYKDYVVGWLDSSIGQFLQTFPVPFESMKYALITCLDSNLKPSTLLTKSPELRPVAKEAQSLSKGILLPTQTLLKAETLEQIFMGFDEIWFFPNPISEPKPDAWLVGPARVDEKKLKKLGEWMSGNGCSLALGDGDGLNFIVKARGLVKHLLGHSLEQPLPTVVVESPPSGVAV